MPSPEPHASLEAVPAAEKAPDFAELQKQKEQLFKEIEGDSLSLIEAEKMNAVGTVSNYSIKDGFELARRLGLKGDGTFVAMTYQPVIYKNKKFFSTFHNYLAANEKYVSGMNSTYISSGMRRMERILDSELEDIKWSMDYQADQIGPIAQKINDYYSHFIRNRSLKSREILPDARTQIEMAGEHHLKSAEAVLKESYYTGPVKEMLGLKSEEDLEKAQKQLYDNTDSKDLKSPILMENWAWALRGEVIDRKMLDEILFVNHIHAHDPEVARNLDINDPETARKLRHARYTPSQVVFETRKEGVEEGLVKQIKESLIKRGFKEDEFEITFNKEKGEYEVIDKKEKGELAEDQFGFKREKNGKENLREVEDVPNQIKHGGRNLNLSGVQILDGEVFKDYLAVYNHPIVRILEYPDGTTTDTNKIYPNSPVHKSGDKIMFAGRNVKTNERNLVVDDKEIHCKDYAIAAHIVNRDCAMIEYEGDYYWQALQEYTGRCALIKNDQVFSEFKSGEDINGDVLYEIGGKLTYILRNQDRSSGKTEISYELIFGDERFGPYDEIKLCENSKDKLIFYAKKGDEHIVYVDGVEKKIDFKDWSPRMKEVKNIIRSSGRIDLQIQVGEHQVIYESIIGSDANHGGILILGERSKYTNVVDLDGKLFSIGKDSAMPSVGYFRWGEKTNAIKLESDDHSIVSSHGSAFISDGKRVLILSENKENESRLDFEEMSFDGPVELVNSGGRLFIIESLPDKKRIWEYSEELELNEVEQKDLDLANAVAKEDIESIEDYFQRYHPRNSAGGSGPNEYRLPSITESVKEGIKGALEQSKGFVGAVNQTIKEMPELFMDTLRAKDDKPTEYLMTQMFYYMFPEAQAKRERAIAEQKRNRSNPWNIFGGGGEGGGRGGKSETFDYDAGVDRLASVDEAGYYEMMRANREVLKLREPLPPFTFITHGLFGNYAGGGWKKVNVPISQEVSDPAKETTFEFTDEKASQNINLPKIANAKIITERLKGITAKDKEVPVKILEENALGEVRIDKGKEAKRVSYSMTYSEMPTTMAEITADDYGRFRKDFEKSFGDVMTRPIGDIGDELDIFVRGLSGKSPREQVIAIQEFCYQYGYYNLDNTPRDTDSFEERLSIMEGRMDELKSAKPELAGKKYAGICTDFATLTAGLLRKAGFVSGIASGFVPEAGSTSVKTSRAHATAFVLWPGSSGNALDSGLRRNDKTSENDRRGNKPDMIIVDGTPSSITPKIVEQEKKAAGMGKELAVDAEKQLAELERVLKTMDVEAIKKLSNGKLEQTLNHILYGVQQPHVDVMSRVLNASRYAGFDILEMARGNLEDQIEFRKFLEEEIYKEKSIFHENRERRGEELFKLMLEFTRRFEKDRNVKGKQEALDVLETVFDTAGKYLDPVEQRSAAAIVTYLRAKKMR